eukprot:2516765-Rhodomonas_salina.2
MSRLLVFRARVRVCRVLTKGCGATARSSSNVKSTICLCACYAMPGAESADDTTRERIHV